MKKKVMSAVLAAAMVVGMAGNVVTVSAEEKYDLTLYSIDTTDPDFEDWLANVEDATGLNINVIAAPTDTDTRQQKITTMLSTGDTSVDVIEINMITDKDGNIIGVPGYTGYFAFWVNQEIMDEVGIKSIDTKEDFMKYMKAVSKDGRFGYGGSWEKTYAFNELAQFVNMFGGDYFDWTKEENKEAVQFLHDLVANKETSIEQIADKYDQMNPKINDGKYGCWFMWGLGTDYAKADMLGADKIHMEMVPDFSGKGERAIFTDSWSYVLNKASKNKDAAVKFLQYMADEGGMEASYKAFDRYPARKDVAEKVVPDSDPAKEMYSRYANECNVQGRPMVAQTMEFISDMGTIFQSCMKDEITVDEFCKKAQDVVDMYK